MPRRTRKRISSPLASVRAAAPDSDAERPASTSADTSTQETDSFSQAASIFDTTFSLYRASPLFHGLEPLTASRLQLIAQRLRETLVGDVVRGVEVGLEPGGAAVGGAGTLEAVTLQWVALDEAVETPQKALYLSLQYENAVSTGLFMPLPSVLQAGSAEDSRFLHLPLLLLRMPSTVREVVADFFSSTFDCRISPLFLGTEDLIRSWEGWTRDIGLPTTGYLARDAVLTLGFHIPGSGEQSSPAGTAVAATSHSIGLRTLDIFLGSQDLGHFLKAGQTLVQGDSNVGLAGPRHPLTHAVCQYVKHHLALDMSHPAVRITRIACGGFVLGDGRMKIFGPPRDSPDGFLHKDAVRQLVVGLVERARGAVQLDR